MTDRLLTQREVAERLRLTVEAVRRMRYRGVLPYVRLGTKTVRVRESDLEQFIEKGAA